MGERHAIFGSREDPVGTAPSGETISLAAVTRARVYRSPAARAKPADATVRVPEETILSYSGRDGTKLYSFAPLSPRYSSGRL